MCGEQAHVLLHLIRVLGSPPRVRGTDTHIVIRLRKSRITPACAGNRQSSIQTVALLRDHPRVCGEQLSASELLFPIKGSPPRVRGTDTKTGKAMWNCRITPACAGNSKLLLYHFLATEDHPRVCGEQVQTALPMFWLTGSPPRVRGTASRTTFANSHARITPACAGNSCCRVSAVVMRKDHPRVCGEQATSEYREQQGKGSPPRVRGTERSSFLKY